MKIKWMYIILLIPTLSYADLNLDNKSVSYLHGLSKQHLCKAIDVVNDNLSKSFCLEKESSGACLEWTRRNVTVANHKKELERRGLILADCTKNEIPSSTPSFDCKKATARDEFLICKDEELGELDIKLVDSYKKLINILDINEAKEIKKLQRNWLKTRKKITRNKQNGEPQDEYVRILNLRSFYKSRLRSLNTVHQIKLEEKKNTSIDICAYIDIKLNSGDRATFHNSIYEEYIGDYSGKYHKYDRVSLTDDDLNNLPIGNRFIPYDKWKKRKRPGVLTKVDLNYDGIPEYRYHYTLGSASCEDNIIVGKINNKKYDVINPEYNPFYGEASMCGASATYVKFKGSMYALISRLGNIHVYKYNKSYKINKICDLKKKG